MESEGKTRKPTGTRYSDEVRERAIRMVFEHQHEYQTQGAAIRSNGRHERVATLN
jgi:transposase